LFSQHDSLSETQIYRTNLLEFLIEKSSTKTIELDEIDNAMKFFGSYVDVLLSKNLISIDDSETYKEVKKIIFNFSDLFDDLIFNFLDPLFDPCYVFYDEDSDYYSDLSNVYKEIFKLK
jgi:hypothetical protein